MLDQIPFWHSIALLWLRVIFVPLYEDLLAFRSELFRATHLVYLVWSEEVELQVIFLRSNCVSFMQLFFFWEEVNSGKSRFPATEMFLPVSWWGKCWFRVGALYNWMVTHVQSVDVEGAVGHGFPLLLCGREAMVTLTRIALLLQDWGVLTLSLTLGSNLGAIIT